MSTCADVGSVIGPKTSVVQTSNVGFTSEVSDYVEVHTGPGEVESLIGQLLVSVCLKNLHSSVHPSRG